MLVSIILPTKDRPNWLPRAVASIRNQTDHQWELIVLDNSEHPYYQHNPWFDHRITYEHQLCEGVADAYTKALQIATGDVILPLGDDDVVPTTLVETVRRVFADPAVMWANARTQLVDERGATFAMRGGDPHSVDTTRAGSYWLGGAVWWRPELTADRGFDPRFDGAADFDLYLRFLEHSDPALIDEVMYVYTDWAGTDSRQRTSVQQAHSATIAREWRIRQAAG